MSRTKRPKIPNFLCDTWWYGLTDRWDNDMFTSLAKLRSDQGFTAVQMVIGIPPEVAPENQNASSKFGPAWNLKGEFNKKYLDNARSKIRQLNSYGLTVIVYGGWGQQIEWLGVQKMKDWWQEIINKLDDLDVMYCITGESDIWVGEENKLLPNKTTAELNIFRTQQFMPPKIIYLGKRLFRMFSKPLNKSKIYRRREKWSDVLSSVHAATQKPIFIHTLPSRTSEDVVNNPELLDAITVQTGHDSSTRNELWQLPLANTSYLNKPFINLEPWYEGIMGLFKTQDQLYAYWVSMMAGAHAYCYGAHGVWNLGDGLFLSQWGKQTLEQALRLDTPRLIGKSHDLYIRSGFADYEKVDIKDNNGELSMISRSDSKGNSVHYIPEVSKLSNLPKGKVYLPLNGSFSDALPGKGQALIVSSDKLADKLS